jgi:putative transposase
MRRDLLIVGQIYHIFTKSIAEFSIFNNNSEFLRMLEIIHYYQIEKPEVKFSKFTKSQKVRDTNLNKEKLVEIVAYCLMPTHLHLVLKQLKQNGISIFMSNILNSYTRYFNIKHNRKGPLWEGRFKNVLVESDEHLLHLTRYIHLNPVTAYLIDKPEEWPASSYNEYLLNAEDKNKLCNYDKIMNIEPVSYKKFVEDRASYQRELAGIKLFLLE